MINNLLIRRHLELKLQMDEIEFIYLGNEEKYPIDNLVVNYITKEIYVLNEYSIIPLVKGKDIIRNFDFGVKEIGTTRYLMGKYLSSPESLIMNPTFIMDILLSKRKVKYKKEYPKLYKSLSEEEFKLESKSLIGDDPNFLIFLEKINPLINVISFNLLIYHILLNPSNIIFRGDIKEYNVVKFSKNIEFNFLKEWFYI